MVVNENGAIEKAQVVDSGTNTESTEHPHVYKWEDLEQKYQKDHGTFYFGPHSHQIKIPDNATFEYVL